MELKGELLYEIYTDTNDDSYDVGVFITQDKENIVFQSVNVNGFDDGLLLLKKDDIHKVQFNTPYTISIQKLMEYLYRKIKYKNIKFKKDNLMTDFLNFAKTNGSIVGIELNNSGVVNMMGFIEELSDEYITTLELDIDGSTIGNGQARISDINKISIDAFKHQKHKILFETNSKK